MFWILLEWLWDDELRAFQSPLKSCSTQLLCNFSCKLQQDWKVFQCKSILDFITSTSEKWPFLGGIWLWIFETHQWSVPVSKQFDKGIRHQNSCHASKLNHHYHKMPTPCSVLDLDVFDHWSPIWFQTLAFASQSFRDWINNRGKTTYLFPGCCMINLIGLEPKFATATKQKISM